MLSVSPTILSLKHRYSYSLNLIHALSSIPTYPDQRYISFLLQAPQSPFRLLQIHAQIFRLGAHQDNLLATRLIGQYPIQFALRVFNLLKEPNIFPFNATIRILAEKGFHSRAFSLFKILNSRYLSPNDFTFSFILKACFQSSDARNVKQIHTHIVKLGFNHNSSVCSGLLAVYAKSVRDTLSGRRVFDEMPESGMVCSWTCMIAGYVQLGQSEEALLLYLRMIKENLRPQDDTMVSVLSACSRLEVVEVQRWVEVFSRFDCGGGDDEIMDFCRDSINTVLVYLYGKWGKIEKSSEAFNRISDSGRSLVVPWNAMISVQVQNGCPMDALRVFRLMMVGSNRRPNHVTMVSVLSACAQVGDLDVGSWIHEYAKSKGCKGILESNTFLATAIIDMYSKCGSLGKAKEVFNQMVDRDVVSFNAMIMGLAINGEGEEALRLFSQMEKLGVHPNGGTFVCVLSACNHSGLVGEGHRIFLDMDSRYSIIPKLEHYACYVDLLARVGHVEEALKVVLSMPVEPNGLVWGALLGGCLVHSKVDLARDVAKSLFEVDPVNSAGYVLLSNAFASNRQWDKIAGLRGMMREKGVSKQPGCSWITVDGVVHEFRIGCIIHPRIESIYHILDVLLKEMKQLGP
ncbi:hypothetical protein HHK36_001103 [Tetracentron sinense]|uniref:Pentatricopeptide repeat-containing protein n=1 Tax=Tetracentron sinense TaxID=13715 RepID=A0A834ZVF2_TETSI|nr:hypothetical protein HHK36_001103 [Tetracentron sinense]